MSELNWSWPLISLLALGTFHGLNPAMGWLFAVARGLQERRLSAVATALGLIALGHALAIGLTALAVAMLGFVLPTDSLLVAGGIALLAFGGYKVARRFRHPRWVGMRVRSHELVLWSFLMATGHGAGLMVIPPLMRLSRTESSGMSATAGHAAHIGHTLPSGHMASAESEWVTSLLAVGLHTAAMFLAMGILAIVVYRRIGLEVLRRAWLNVDLVWVAALMITGAITVGHGFWALIAR